MLPFFRSYARSGLRAPSSSGSEKISRYCGWFHGDPRLVRTRPFPVITQNTKCGNEVCLLFDFIVVVAVIVVYIVVKSFRGLKLFEHMFHYVWQNICGNINCNEHAMKMQFQWLAGKSDGWVCSSRISREHFH